MQGPPPEPGSEKRILLAFVLTFVVIAAMQPLISKYGKQPAKPAEPPAQQSQAAQPSGGGTAAAQGAAGQAASEPARRETPQKAAQPRAKAGNSSASSAATKQASSESETVVETDLYRVTFTNQGALVKSWVLKKYDDDKGKPLELVHPIAAPQYGYPLSLWTYDEALRKQLNSALYVAQPVGPDAAAGTPGKAARVVNFEYSDGSVTVRKTFSFDDTYVVRVDTEVTQNGNRVLALVAWPAGFGDETVPAAYANSMVDYQNQDSIERIGVKKVQGGNTIKGPFHWAGASDQYFAAVYLPDDPNSATLVTLHDTIKLPKNLDKPDPNQTIDVPVVGIAAGSAMGMNSGRLFVGPKALKVLDRVHSAPIVNGQPTGPDIAKLVDFGRWFGWLARPLFEWLEWTHDHWISNWGWAIALLTVIITVAVMPLRISSMKSALKMQKVQPQIKAIQEKYKKYKMSDPRRADMNKEMGELYKKEGINPAGGCVPLLLQMPFLIAFYSMLGVAIELRHAPWLWIKDLSSPDPLHILPIAIIVTMFWVQKMTPQGGMDPVQQKMMSIMMPVMLGVISWNLAAGLCVYWAIGNVLAIVQQYWINNSEFGREMRAAMEKRKNK